MRQHSDLVANIMIMIMIMIMIFVVQQTWLGISTDACTASSAFLHVWCWNFDTLFLVVCHRLPTSCSTYAQVQISVLHHKYIILLSIFLFLKSSNNVHAVTYFLFLAFHMLIPFKVFSDGGTKIPIWLDNSFRDIVDYDRVFTFFFNLYTYGIGFLWSWMHLDWENSEHN